MTLASNVTAVAMFAPPVSAPPRQSVTLFTLDGRAISGGIAEFAGSVSAWSATISVLDRPGSVATCFYAEGVRDVILRLADGRTLRARLTGTRFLASARVCTLADAGATTDARHSA